MHHRNRETDSSDGGGRPDSTSDRQRPTVRSADSANGAARIDLVAVYWAIGLSFVVIPLVVGYAFVGGTVPSPGSAAFHALGATVMAPGLLMGAAALWLCARSDTR